MAGTQQTVEIAPGLFDSRVLDTLDMTTTWVGYIQPDSDELRVPAALGRTLRQVSYGQTLTRVVAHMVHSGMPTPDGPYAHPITLAEQLEQIMGRLPEADELTADLGRVTTGLHKARTKANDETAHELGALVQQHEGKIWAIVEGRHDEYEDDDDTRRGVRVRVARVCGIAVVSPPIPSRLHITPVVYGKPSRSGKRTPALSPTIVTELYTAARS